MNSLIIVLTYNTETRLLILIQKRPNKEKFVHHSRGPFFLVQKGL